MKPSDYLMDVCRGRRNLCLQFFLVARQMLLNFESCIYRACVRRDLFVTELWCGVG